MQSPTSGLLPPIIKQDNGLMITYFNNAELQLREQGYDERQIKVIVYVIEHGQITNANVQEMFIRLSYSLLMAQANVHKDVHKELTERQRVILSVIEKDCTITAQKIAQKIVTKTEKGFNQYTTKTQLFFVGGRT